MSTTAARAPGATASEDHEREAALTALVDRWTAHMRWRKNYDRWREDRLWQEDHQQSRLDATREACAGRAHPRVLDIGAGMGGFLVAARRNGIAAVGIEPHADYCRITRLRAARYHQPPGLLRAVGERLPFRDKTFDVIWAQDILEHVADPARILAEIRRVLKPDGVAYVTAINRFAWRDPHYHLYGLNWLPRPIAEGVIAARGRSKRGARFSDHQRLSEMYYDTFAGFQRLAARHGLAATDRKEQLLSTAPLTTRGRYAGIVRLLARAHLTLPVYRTYRFAVVATYEVALRPMVGSA